MVEQLEFEAVTETPENRWEREFREWVSTPGGLAVKRRCARKARWFMQMGKRTGIKGIWELVRYDLRQLRAQLADRGKRLPKVDGFALNNNFTAYMARELEKSYPDLRGFFELRGLGGRPWWSRRRVLVSAVHTKVGGAK